MGPPTYNYVIDYFLTIRGLLAIIYSNIQSCHLLHQSYGYSYEAPRFSQLWILEKHQTCETFFTMINCSLIYNFQHVSSMINNIFVSVSEFISTFDLIKKQYE